MFNPKSSRVTLTRDIIWLGWMYYPRRNAKLTQLLPIVAVPISQYSTDVEEENAAGIKIITEEPLISKEREGTISDKSSSEKGEDSGWIVHRTRYECPTGLKSGMYNLSTGKAVQWTDIATVSVNDKNEVTANYYDVLGIDKCELEVLQNNHEELIKYVNVGAGIGGGFTNTLELKVMKYHEAINGPDGKAWKEEVRKEHQRMINNGIFEPVKISELPKGIKLIDTIWAMKKKSSGTLRGRVNLRGFFQIEGEHYDGTSISALVTNAMTMKMSLTLMLMQGGIARVVNVKRAFLYGKFDSGDKSHMDAMLQCMQYLKCTKDAGLFLKPERKWDGSDSFQFKINRRSDSDYTKDTQARWSITGYIIYFEGAPVMHGCATHTEDSCLIFL
jgi:hypothetical protein